MPMYPGMCVWPGDKPYEFEITAALSEGSSVNLGSVAMSLHTGTHADAPCHFSDNGASMAELSLDPFVGLALVIEVLNRACITIDDIKLYDLTGTPRLLIRTGAWEDRTTFPERIHVMSPDLPAYLHSYGVVLIGLDVPSVDALESKELPLHHALEIYQIRILESLDLSHVPPGSYELVALPLKIVGGDGSPVRAILRTVELRP